MNEKRRFIVEYFANEFGEDGDLTKIEKALEKCEICPTLDYLISMLEEYENKRLALLDVSVNEVKCDHDYHWLRNVTIPDGLYCVKCRKKA